MDLRKNKESGGGSQWIAVYITHNLPEAHILLGKLQANEIPAMIHQEAGATALGITFGNLGEIKILVSPADYEQAVDLLLTETDDQIEASSNKIQLIWQDDGDGAEYYVDDGDE